VLFRSLVLVPNHLLGRHLQRVLADAGTPHVNIRFLTLAHLAERLAGPRMRRKGLRPAPRFCDELLLDRAIAARQRPLRYFSPVAGLRGFHRAVLATIRDLKEAGSTPDDLTAAGSLAQSHPALRDKLRDLTELWRAAADALAARKLYDPADLAAEAVRAAPESPWLGSISTLIVYGFYDLNGLQARLLRACFERLPAAVYFPFADHAVFDYARPALDWFIAQGFERRETGPARSLQPKPCAGRTLQAASRVADPSTMLPAETLLVSAPGEDREVEEVIREALRANDPADPRGTVGVLVRSGLSEPYGGLLTETLDAVGLAGYLHGHAALSRTRAARALQMLTGLLQGDLPRREVMEFLATAPLRRVE
jgi:hypothetical protein